MSQPLHARPVTLVGLAPATPPSGVRCKHGCLLRHGAHTAPCRGTTRDVPVRMGYRIDGTAPRWWAHAPGCTAYAHTPSAALALLERGTGVAMGRFDLDHDSLYYATCAALGGR